MNLGIVILNYNNYWQTLECVKQLKKIKAPGIICIVDNNSNNNSFDILNDKYKNDNKIYVLKNNVNSGYAAGNNVGLRFCIEKLNCEALCVMNPDVKILYTDFLKNLYKVLYSNKEIGMVGAIVLSHGNFDINYSGWDIPNIKNLLKSRLCTHKGWNNSLENAQIFSRGQLKVDCIAGCFYMFKSEVLQQIGYLDENTFLYYEELITGFKLKRKKFKSIICLSDFYEHNHEINEYPTVKTVISSQKYGLQSTNYILKKYYNKPQYCLQNNIIYLMNVVLMAPWHYFKNLVFKK